MMYYLGIVIGMIPLWTWAFILAYQLKRDEKKKKLSEDSNPA